MAGLLKENEIFPPFKNSTDPLALSITTFMVRMKMMMMMMMI